MAGDWIKFEHATPDKPEIFRMAAILKIDPDAVVGKLVRFWTWCDQQTLDGNSLGVPEPIIDRLTHQPGFSAALREVSWLQARSGSLAIPNFDRHNGQTAKVRALDNRNKAKQREKGRMSPVCPDLFGTNGGTREEKRREEKIENKPDSAEPPAASTPEDPIVFVFPTVGGTHVWHLRESKLKEYRETFPALDVEAQMRSARQWCVDNEAKRKTERGMPKFLFAWLERSQNSNKPSNVTHRQSTSRGFSQRDDYSGVTQKL